MMVAFNQYNRVPSAGSNPLPPLGRLVERVRGYLDQHPEVTREEFLLDAMQREIVFREQREMRSVAETVGRELGATSRRFTHQSRPSAADIRMHGLLAERLAVLHYERYGLWPKFRRFLFGKRTVRLPELGPSRTVKG